MSGLRIFDLCFKTGDHPLVAELRELWAKKGGKVYDQEVGLWDKLAYEVESTHYSPFHWF